MSIKSCKLNLYVETNRRRNSLLSLALRIGMMSNISFSFTSTSPLCDRKLKVELRTHCKIQMILKAIEPLSRLYLAEEEDRKGCNTHVRRLFCIFLFVFVLDCPYLAGNSLTVISVSHF